MKLRTHQQYEKQTFSNRLHENYSLYTYWKVRDRKIASHYLKAAKAIAKRMKRHNLLPGKATNYKNPQDKKVCEYCRMLSGMHQRAHGSDKRRVLVRYKLHRRALHKNPMGGRKRLAIKAAIKIAKKLYDHFKTKGVPAFLMERLPPDVRGIVEDILRYNGVRIVTANPARRKRK